MKAGAIYFVPVFGAGFMLGLVRIPFLVPGLGERVAELLVYAGMPWLQARRGKAKPGS